MHLIKLAISLGLLLSIITSCDKKDQVVEPSTGNQSNGVVKGTVYSPNGKLTLASVIVETTVNGSKRSDTTGTDGRFELELPPGEYLVKMYAGSGTRLFNQQNLTIKSENVTEVPASQSRLQYTGKIAFVPGEYDDIQSLVKEMGIPVTELTLQDMQDYNKLKQYDVLLLNCLSSYIDFEENKLLERFLKEGHSIYASDFEMRSLSQQEWGFIPENLLGYNYEGVHGNYKGRVLFEPFQKALGKNSIDIEFDMPSYVQITKLKTDDSRIQVLVDHQEIGPLAIAIQWGQTRTSTQGIPYGGKIIYTTFHDALLSQDVKTVLRQMILQL